MKPDSGFAFSGPIVIQVGILIYQPLSPHMAQSCTNDRWMTQKTPNKSSIHCMDYINHYCLMAVFNVTYLENEDYE